MPRKILPLTDVQIKNAKARSKAWKLTDGDGLHILVTPSGGKLWRLKYRHGGKEKLLSFGAWPEIGLKRARELRLEARSLVAEGIDPGEKRKEAKAVEEAQAVVAANTFSVVARKWHAKQSRLWSQDHAARNLRRLENHIFPVLGDIPVGDILPEKLLGLLQGLEEQGKYETAHRLRGLCDNIFVYAIAAQLTKSNPALAISKALAPVITVHRPAIVDPPEVGRLMRMIWGYMGSPLVRGCLQITALTAVRPGEARQMEWSEINIDGPHGPLWIIPGPKTKLRRDHLVPLAPQVVAILETLRDMTGQGQFVFPNSRDGSRPMADMSMNMALRRLGFGSEEACSHGFRSTFSTLTREAGWPHHVIEAVLAHLQGNSVSQAYDRAQYLPERRKILEWWVGYLDTLKSMEKVMPGFGAIKTGSAPRSGRS